MAYLWNNPTNTYKIFNFLNSNTALSGGSSKTQLDDLEFDDVSDSNELQMDDDDENRKINESEYTDLLLPKFEGYSRITSKSTEDDIYHDLESSMTPQNMSLEILEQIYGKKDAANVKVGDKSQAPKEKGKSSNINGGEDSETEDEYNYYFSDSESKDDDSSAYIPDDIDNIYASVKLDDELPCDPDTESTSETESSSDSETETTSQRGGESINKIVENLGDNDEEAYIKGCKAKDLTGGNTVVKMSGFNFYPY